MGADRVQRGLFPQEFRELIDTCHAARIPDGPEHIVRQVPGMGTDGPAVGMGGYHRRLGDLHNIPEACIADMAHIHQDS